MEDRLLSFNYNFFQTFPLLVVAYTFQPLFYTVQNALSERNQTPYRFMCLGFLSTLLSTLYFIIVSFLVVWKNNVIEGIDGY